MNVIKGLPPASRCYEGALEWLKSRFGDEKRLTQAHMWKLLSIQPVRSADNMRGLPRLYDSLSSNIRGSEALGQKAKHNQRAALDRGAKLTAKINTARLQQNNCKRASKGNFGTAGSTEAETSGYAGNCTKNHQVKVELCHPSHE